jgi:hypothetical protein
LQLGDGGLGDLGLGDIFSTSPAVPSMTLVLAVLNFLKVPIFTFFLQSQQCLISCFCFDETGQNIHRGDECGPHDQAHV